MKYKLTDGHGNVLAQGDQLNLTVCVDLERETIQVSNDAHSFDIETEIVNGDAFTLSFTREHGEE